MRRYDRMSVRATSPPFIRYRGNSTRCQPTNQPSPIPCRICAAADDQFCSAVLLPCRSGYFKAALLDRMLGASRRGKQGTWMRRVVVVGMDRSIERERDGGWIQCALGRFVDLSTRDLARSPDRKPGYSRPAPRERGASGKGLIAYKLVPWILSWHPAPYRKKKRSRHTNSVSPGRGRGTKSDETNQG